MKKSMKAMPMTKMAAKDKGAKAPMAKMATKAAAKTATKKGGKC